MLETFGSILSKRVGQASRDVPLHDFAGTVGLTGNDGSGYLDLFLLDAILVC